MASPKRIIVTGATGFVGSHLVPHLRGAGHDVAVVTRSTTSTADGVEVITDTGDAAAMVEAFKAFNPDVCVHLATYYIANAKDADIDPLIESNVGFGTRVAHAFAQTEGSAFLYTSTFSQHRNGADYDPTVLYAAMKQAYADILRYYANNNLFRVLDLQLFDTFGKGDPRPKIWNLLMNAATSGEALETTEGQQILSPIHVSDVVTAIAHAINLSDAVDKQYSDFRVQGPQPLRLRDAVALFEKVNDITIPVKWGVRQYSGNEMFELWEHGTPLPGWSPQVSLEDGFRELWSER